MARTRCHAPFTFKRSYLYQWVDELGVRHFSQQPPSHLPNLQAVDVSGAPTIFAREPIIQSSPVATEYKGLPEYLENPEKDPIECKKAHLTVSQLQEHERIKAEDSESGELRYLSMNEKSIPLENWLARESILC